jgi:hypothetical protein
MDETKRKEAYQIGVAVFLLLALTTIGEYFIGAYAGVWWPPLIAIAVLKAFYVIRDYMHVGRVFAGEEEVH